MTDSSSIIVNSVQMMGQSESVEPLGAKRENSSSAEECNDVNESRVGVPVSEIVSCGSDDNDNDKHPPTLEWNFIDFTKAEQCPIFTVDPALLKKFVGHNVTVLNSSRERFSGCCLTIDPVSLSVILARRTEEGKIRIITLPGYHLTKIYIDPASVLEHLRVSVNDLDIADLYHAGSLLKDCKPVPRSAENGKENSSQSQIPQDVEPPPTANAKDPEPEEFTPEDIQKRKLQLKNLLGKNLMPCTVKGEVLELPGGVRILPPYTTETCDTKGNAIIRKKLGELIETIKLRTD